jgi:hypothetical protein
LEAREKNIIMTPQERFSTNLQAKCSSDLYRHRVWIRRAAEGMGSKCMAMEEKYVYKFLSSIQSVFTFRLRHFFQPRKMKQAVRS